MIGHTERQRDFITRKYLDDGLIRVKLGGQWTLATATTGQRSGGIVVLPVDRRPQTVMWDVFDVESFSFEPRLMTLHDRVVYISRSGVQSTQRSLRYSDIDVIGVINDFIWNAYRGGQDRLTDSILEVITRSNISLRMGDLIDIGRQFLHTSEKSIKEGLAQLLLGTPDVLLTKDFALTMSGNSDRRPWLWYHKLPVGKIETDSACISVGHPDFHQEIVDLLVHTNQLKDWSIRG